MSRVNSARDVQLRIERAQREAEIIAQREQDEEDRKQEVLKKYPHIRGTFNDRKAKATAVKDQMLSKAKEFYNLDQGKAYEYASLATKPSQIAIKHLVNEITHGGNVAGWPPCYRYIRV